MCLFSNLLCWVLGDDFVGALVDQLDDLVAVVPHEAVTQAGDGDSVFADELARGRFGAAEEVCGLLDVDELRQDAFRAHCSAAWSVLYLVASAISSPTDRY